MSSLSTTASDFSVMFLILKQVHKKKYDRYETSPDLPSENQKPQSYSEYLFNCNVSFPKRNTTDMCDAHLPGA